MSEMMATANAKSIEEIKSFLSRQKEVYKIPYETHPADRPRQCVFGDVYKRQVLCPAQQIIDGNPIEVCQRDKVAMIDFLKIFFFITAKG